MEFNDFTNATETFTTQKVRILSQILYSAFWGVGFFALINFINFISGHVEYSTSVYKQVEHVTVENNYSYSFTYSFYKEKIIKS